ncbi:hypothetical protein [Arthrobacter sp. ZGTC131]|uniref:hypothetical protein n=1 Tax=Arthrobacter sp. ZGTC131 TaxID=2058898 RepID=UPI000CE46537|nr:hypothetical protein [Arthrobacter sp. ZGTC131]
MGKTIGMATLVFAAAIVTFLHQDALLPAFLVPAATGMFWCLGAKGHRKYPLAGIVVLALSGCLALGYSLYPLIENEALVSMRIPFSRLAYDAAFAVIFLSIVSIFFGGLFFLRPPARRQIEDESNRLEVLVSLHAGKLLALSVIPLILYIVGYGPAGLLERRHYLEMAGPQLIVSASSIFGPVGAVLASIVLIVRRSPRHLRTTAGLLLGGYFVVMISTGSRAVAVLPLILLWLFIEFRKPGKLGAAISVVGSLFSVVVLLNASLVFRLEAVGAGLLPYLDVLTEKSDRLFEVRFGQLVGNVLFGVPLTGDIVMSGQLDQQYFWTSINPLPGGLTDWSSILGELSWGPATPFNTFGELYAYGIIYVVMFMFSVGALVSGLDNIISSFDGALRQTLTLVAVISLLLFASAVFQYPVRNASRIVWYLAVVVAGLAMLKSKALSSQFGTPSLARNFDG